MEERHENERSGWNHFSVPIHSSNFLLHTRFFILKFRSTLQEYAH